MKKVILLLIVCFAGIQASAQTEFITTWKTDNPGTSNSTSITIPTTGGGYSYDVDWTNDGAFDDFGVTGNITHDYGLGNEGTYTVAIRGVFPQILFNNGGDAQKILTIEQWGTIAWSSMNNAFAGCTNLQGNAMDSPNLANVTDMSGMFTNTTTFNQDIGNWNVGTVENMSRMFSNATAFNGDIGNWNVASATNMSFMFNNATAFNKYIGGWNVAGVNNMTFMFSNASSFNLYIGGWNVANVNDMSFMFSGASSFNQFSDYWDVSGVANMSNMFANAIAFNGEIRSWDVSGVLDMSFMFVNASAFNQNIGNWNVSNVNNMSNMFTGVTLSTTNYDALLNGWNAQTLQNGVTFSGGNSHYCNGELAKENMITTSGWTITDGGPLCLSTDYFITTWKTDNPGTPGNSITIPTIDSGYNYSVDWGDGTNNTNVTGNITHVYGAPGTYTVKIQGLFPRIYFNNAGDKEKIVSIEQWGIIDWKSMARAFYGCSNLIGNATDAPILTNVTDMSQMFSDASLFNQNLGNWRTESVTNMNSMFRYATAFNGYLSNWEVRNVKYMTGMFFNATAFNQNIGNWNVSNVEGMGFMFRDATAFNQNIGSWNVSSVTDMTNMFTGATAFNQNIGSWNVGSVNNMSYMFSNATAFNQEIGSWNVGSVTNMTAMFKNASAFNGDISGWNVGGVTILGDMFDGASIFNQDIGGWNVAGVTNMTAMFRDATAFNQDIGDWDISKVTSMLLMFNGATLSTANYDATLIGWATDSSSTAGDTIDDIPSNITFSGGNSIYCVSQAERQELIDTFGWTITDGDLGAPPLAVCKNITVQLDPSGNATITGNDVDNGSNLGCSGSATLTVSPSSFNCSNVGANTVTLTVTDITGNTSTCTSMVTVVDDIPPVITSCPANITQSADPGSCTATVTVPSPTFTDNCSNSCVQNDDLDGYTLGPIYNQGPEWATWTGAAAESAEVSNEQALSGSQSLKVTGIPAGGPVDQLYLLGDKTSGVWNVTYNMFIPVGNTGYTNIQKSEIPGVEYSTTLAFKSDGTGLLTDNGSSDFTYPQGSWFEVKHSINLDDNAISVSINGNVIRTNPYTVAGGLLQLGAIDFYPGTVDSDPNPAAIPLFYVDDISLCQVFVTNNFNNTDNASGVYPVGETNVVWTITDFSGNTDTCTQVIIIEDNEAPEITCPANITQECTTVTYSDPTVADGCDQTNLSLTTLFAPNFALAGNMFDVTAINDITINSFDVNIQGNASETVEVYYKTGSYVGSEFIPEAWTLLATTTVTSAGVNVPTPLNLSLGQTVNAGQTVAFWITLTTSTNLLYSTGNVPTADANLQFTPGIAVTYPLEELAYDRTWNGNIIYDVVLNPVTIVQTAGLPSGSIFPIGTTTNTFEATDPSGNTETCSFEVTILADSVAPVITCPADIIQECVTVTYPEPTVTDGCEQTDLSLTTLFSPTYKFNGNMFDVTAITDITINSFDLNIEGSAVETIEVYFKTGSYVGSEVLVGAWTLLETTTVTSAGVNVPTPLNLSLGQTINAGQTVAFWITLTTSQNLLYTSGAFPTADPNLQFSPGATVSYPLGQAGLDNTWNGTIIYDVMPTPVSIVQTAGLPSGSAFPYGTTTNSFEATDVSGNTASCSFDVTIDDPTNSCSSCLDLATYTSSGWVGTPSINNQVIIETDYDTSILGSLEACILIVNSGATLTISVGESVLVNGDITVDGNLIVNHEGSLVQIDDAASVINNGTISVEKTTPIIAEKAFMLLGSPMTSETREGVYANSYIVRNHITGNFVPNPEVELVSPGSNNWADDNGNNWLNHTGLLTPAEGYLVFPQPDGTSSGVFTHNYTQGTLNNGVITKPLLFNTSQNDSPNMLANPYASAIDAEVFFDDPANSGIDVLYFWEHITPLSITYPGYNATNFSMADISMYSESLGAGVAAASGGTTPTRFIASGQGFGVKPTAAGIVQFNNTMRITGPNDTYRRPIPVERDRLWINVFNDTYGLGSTALIGFTENTSDGFIPSEDVKRLATPVSIYSELDSEEQLAINALGSFEIEDAFYLGFSTQVKEIQDYRISIQDIDGLNLENATVYLIDAFNGSLTNLSEGDYTFQSGEAKYSKRFKVVFEYGALGINENAISQINLYPNPTEGQLNIASPNSGINTIMIFDLQGRKVASEAFAGNTNVQIDISNLNAAIYFVDITTDAGTVIKRLIKK